MEEQVRADIFRRKYSEKLWGDHESESGGGSTLVSTARLRAALPELLEKLEIKSILDIPCGDFYWMREVDMPDIDYLGGDIVGDLVLKNVQKYSDALTNFDILDVLTSELPKVDLIICRDCLMHFSFEDAFKAMENLCKSGSKYLLTTTFPHHENVSIETGDWYPINLQREPFPLGVPMLLLNEGDQDLNYCDKSVGLWRIES
jgi:SAM-dependent methyltransferase